jgi:Tfp pilus assembly protein PilV
MSSFPLRKTAHGFILLEIMLAVMIFSIGVISLAYAVNNCLNAEIMRADDQRAELVLQNTMASIEQNETNADQNRTEALTGMFQGLSLQVTNTPLNWQNENGQDLTGLNQIDLKVSWPDGTQTVSKSLQFYVLRAQ